jgi:hypothetical protein
VFGIFLFKILNRNRLFACSRDSRPRSVSFVSPLRLGQSNGLAFSFHASKTTHAAPPRTVLFPQHLLPLLLIRYDFIVIGPSSTGKSTFARCLLVDQIDPAPFIPVFRRNLLELAHCLIIFQRQLASSDHSFSSSLTPEAIDFLLALDPHHPAAPSTPGLTKHLDRLLQDPGFRHTVEILSSLPLEHKRAATEFLIDVAPPCIANVDFFLENAQRILSNDFAPSREETLLVYHRHVGSSWRYSSSLWDREEFERERKQFLQLDLADLVRFFFFVTIIVFIEHA